MDAPRCYFCDCHFQTGQKFFRIHGPPGVRNRVVHVCNECFEGMTEPITLGSWLRHALAKSVRMLKA